MDAEKRDEPPPPSEALGPCPVSPRLKSPWCHICHLTAFPLILLGTANRKTRSPLNSSLPKTHSEMSRSKPRSPSYRSATARPIAMSHTSSMKTKRKAMS
ncbi:hypothetical protein TNCV_1272321 [Trichonephila clavipes]|nr:hypothetical protein TNCV_1272321 [Trichonephila clavipes]